MILYECQGNSQQLYEMSREGGGMCNRQMLPCNAIVASWVKGSKVRQTIQIHFFVVAAFLLFFLPRSNIFFYYAQVL